MAVTQARPQSPYHLAVSQPWVIQTMTTATGNPMKLNSIMLAVMLLAAPAASASAARRSSTVDGFDRLVIPVDSPVTLDQAYDEGAAFSGRFTLTVTFFFGCPGCRGVSEEDLPVYFVPDPEDAKRLPHWRRHDNAIRISLYPLPEFDPSVMALRAKVVNGESDIVMVHASIVVEDFTTTLDCGTANFQATFVAFADPPKPQYAEWGRNYGCG